MHSLTKCLIILMFFGFPGILLAQQIVTQALQIQVSDTILVGSEPDYPPYCIVDKHGEAEGFSIDLFNAAAKEAGLQVRFKIGVWNKIKDDLAKGKLDALPIVGRTPEREPLFDFTLPYMSLHGAVFVRKGTTDIHTLEDLANKEIMVMRGDNAEEFLRRENITSHIITTNTFEEAFNILESGKHDAVLMQRITGIELLKTMGLNTIEPLSFQIPEFRQDFCFAVKKGNTELLSRLNEGLSIIIANGIYEEIRYKWFGPLGSESRTFKNYLKNALYIFIPILFLLILLWIYFLRREVERRTRNLNAEVTEHKKTLGELKAQQQLLHQSEMQIRLLLNSTAEGIFSIDLAGNCTLINRSALNILGYENAKEVIGKNMHNLIHHKKKDGSICNLDNCKIFQSSLNGHKSQSSNDYFWRADGSSFPAEYFSYPIQQNGNISGAVVTFWDITSRKAAEDELMKLKNDLEIQVAQRTEELEVKVNELQKSQKAMLYMVEDLNQTTAKLKEERHKLRLSNKELEAFTYSVSHDLRAPLRAINGFSRFLAEDYLDKLDKEGIRYLETIRSNATKMDQLITDLLNLSRVTRSDISLTAIDMKATAISMFHEIATKEEKKAFEFIIEDMPLAKCDMTLIKQVWQNLIGNALKYSSKSAIKKIHISCTEKEDVLLFTIKDYGAGFNNKYVDKVFGIFQRLHGDNEYEGNGVGLAIVERIIHRHLGEVMAFGEPGKGAAFSFTIPK